MCVLGKVFFDVLMFQVYLLFKDHKFTKGLRLDIWAALKENININMPNLLLPMCLKYTPNIYDTSQILIFTHFCLLLIQTWQC